MFVGALHIFWCWFLIDCFDFGVRGAALASIATEFTNFLLQTIYLFYVIKSNPKFEQAVGLPNRGSFSIEGL